jgi:hypothetical protein
LDDEKNDAYPDDNLWKDAELIRWANWAEREACIRAKLLFDKTTAGLAVYTLGAGEFEATMDRRVLFIERAWFDGEPLAVTDEDQLRHCYGSRWANRTGTPQAYYTTNGVIGLFPKPLNGGELATRCCRLPLTPMNSINDTPEIPEPYHMGLVEGILSKAYMKQDVETLDKQAAADNAAVFAATFGAQISVKTQQHQRSRTPKTTKYRVV